MTAQERWLTPPPTRSELPLIDEKDIDRLKEIFVPRQECQEINEEIKTKLSNDLVRLAVIENQLKVITWLLYAVAGGVITMLIKMLFGG